MKTRKAIHESQIDLTYTANGKGIDRVKLSGNVNDGYTVVTSRWSCAHSHDSLCTAKLVIDRHFDDVNDATKWFTLTVQTCLTEKLEVRG